MKLFEKKIRGGGGLTDTKKSSNAGKHRGYPCKRELRIT